MKDCTICKKRLDSLLPWHLKCLADYQKQLAPKFEELFMRLARP